MTAPVRAMAPRGDGQRNRRLSIPLWRIIAASVPGLISSLILWADTVTIIALPPTSLR